MLFPECRAGLFGEGIGVWRRQRDAQALEGETHRADDVHPLAHEVVAQLDLQQVALHVLADVLDGRQQFLIAAGHPGKQLGVVPVGLAHVLVNRMDLARIGHQHPVPLLLEEATGPRTVHPDLHRHQRAGITAAQRGEAPAAVGDRLLLEDLSLGVQHAHRMLAGAEVDSDGYDG